MTAPVYAAGAVVWRVVDGKLRILVIHRTRHQDVTLPKGKVDPGESLPQTAVREVEEETGLAVALGVPLGTTHYNIAGGRPKMVYYWAAEATEKAVLRSTFVPNDEVAALEWVSLKRAREYLSFSHDVEIVNEFARFADQGVLETFALIVLRHGKAVPPTSWDGRDSTRPLNRRGHTEALAAARTIQAWAPRRLVSSTAKRCRSTIAPLGTLSRRKISITDDISQDAFATGDARVRDAVGRRVRARKTTVFSSHRPVIPQILREIALATGTPIGSYLDEAAELPTGAFSVVHLSKSHPSAGIVSIETHAPTPDV